MEVYLSDKILAGDWWLKGCALKLLMYITKAVLRSEDGKLAASRAKLATAIDATEWGVRAAIDVLKKKGFIIQAPSKPKQQIVFSLSASYAKSLNTDRQATAKDTANKPRPRRAAAKSQTAQNADVQGVQDVGNGAVPPSDRQEGAKQRKQEKSPKPPKRSKEVLPDGRGSLSDDKTLLHKRARETFEQVYRELYDTPYYWTAADAGSMTHLLNKIKFARLNYTHHGTVTPLPVDNDSLINALRQFLLSINKEWISNNYSVKIINSAYNEIRSELKNQMRNGNSKQTPKSGDTAADARRAEIANSIAASDAEWYRKHGISPGDSQSDATKPDNPPVQP